MSATPMKNLADDIVDLIAQKTRNYAKRQITFLTKLQKTIQKGMKSDTQWQNCQVEEWNISNRHIIDVQEQLQLMMQDLKK